MKSKKEIDQKYKKLQKKRLAIKDNITELDWEELKEMMWFLDSFVEKWEQQEAFLNTNNGLAKDASKLSNKIWKKINQIDNIK
jgi:hypothetical protein